MIVYGNFKGHTDIHNFILIWKMVDLPSQKEDIEILLKCEPIGPAVSEII